MTARRSAWFLAALLAAPAARATGSREAGLPQPVAVPLPGDLLGATVHRLPNGLTVYLSPNAQRPRVTAWVAVRTGSRNDPADCTGLAHYLEHMLFKGSEKLGTLDFAREKPHLDRIVALYEQRFRSNETKERERLYREIDRENVAAAAFEVPNELDRLYSQLGFDGVNAFTMDEGTIFVCDFPKNRAEAWARLEADRFAHPVFRLFLTELETVYEEKNRSLDNADHGFEEEFARRLFPRHPYGTQPTLGSIEHLKNPSLKRMYDYFHARYHPNNMCVALAGDFDPAAMLALLAGTLGAWEPADLPADRAWPLPAPRGEVRFTLTFEGEERVQVGWLLPARGGPDEDALRVMDMLMDNASTGLINLGLVQAQKVKAAGSYLDQENEAGSWVMWATPVKDQTPAQALALLLETAERLKRGEFTDDDIRAVITNFEVGEKRALESNEARVNRMAMSFVERQEWAHAAGWLDRLRRVTRADVMRVAGRFLGPGRVVGFRRNGKPVLPTIAKPPVTHVEIDPSRQSAFYTELAAIPAPPIAPRWLQVGRDYTATNRPFGRLYTAPNPENDVFDLTFTWDRGTDDERELGAALQLLDLAGAGSLSREAYRKALYALGTSVSYGADERWSTLSISGLESRLEESLALVRQQFLHPVLEPGTLDKMKQVILGAQADRKRSPGGVFHALAQYAERGPDSAVLHELKPAEVQALAADRLLALARGLWDAPADVTYAGTRAPDAVAGAIAAAWELPRGARPDRRPLRFTPPAKTRILFTHRDMVQSRVYIVTPDGPLDPGHAVDEQFYSQYMGGDMGSVIFQEVREARALAYAAWGGYVPGNWAGDDNRVEAQLGCQADKTAEAGTLLLELLRRPPWSATRFVEASRAVEQAYRTQPVVFRDAPHAVLRWEEQGIKGGDPGPGNFARAGAYTLADLEAFGSRFAARPFTIAILGHRDRVDLKGLAALGAVEDVPLDSLFPY